MTILELWIERVDEEILRIQRDLALGNAKDYAHYMHASGRFKGLTDAKGLMVEIRERLEKEYNDE